LSPSRCHVDWFDSCLKDDLWLSSIPVLSPLCMRSSSTRKKGRERCTSLLAVARSKWHVCGYPCTCVLYAKLPNHPYAQEIDGKMAMNDRVATPKSTTNVIVAASSPPSVRDRTYRTTNDARTAVLTIPCHSRAAAAYQRSGSWSRRWFACGGGCGGACRCATCRL
jgi:hypothetical protein